MKKGKNSFASQIFSSYHLAIIAPSLIVISIFCFGFVLANHRAEARLGASAHAKPAPSAIKPSGELPLSTKTQLSQLPVAQADGASSDSQQTATPQSQNPGGGNQLQKAAQHHGTSSAAGNSSSNSEIQQLIKVIAH